MPDDPIPQAADFLLTHTDHGWLRLLADHPDDGTGHCTRCHTVWPCTLWTIARHAQRRAMSGR